MTNAVTATPIELRKIAYRLEQNSIPVTECGCLIWLGATRNKSRDYGCLRYQGQVFQTHQAAWIAAHGKIPNGLHVLHKCDVRSCVNPDHLFLGTNADNVRDRVAKGRKSGAAGSKNGRAKLSDDEVRTIQISKESGPALARRYGVTRTTINAIKQRKIWRHL